jgi:hypothetical protein
MATRGQPPVEVTEAAVTFICDRLAAGVDNATAVAASGLSLRTCYRLKARGKAGDDPPAVAFLAAVKKAEADAVVRNVALVQKAAQNGTWQAAAWWLERRHPDEHGSDRRRIRMLKKSWSRSCPRRWPARIGGARE